MVHPDPPASLSPPVRLPAPARLCAARCLPVAPSPLVRLPAPARLCAARCLPYSSFSLRLALLVRWWPTAQVAAALYSAP